MVCKSRGLVNKQNRRKVVKLLDQCSEFKTSTVRKRVVQQIQVDQPAFCFLQPFRVAVRKNYSVIRKNGADEITNIRVIISDRMRDLTDIEIGKLSGTFLEGAACCGLVNWGSKY